jgi:hypothetical protein
LTENYSKHYRCQIYQQCWIEKLVSLGDTSEILKEFGIDQKKIKFEAEKFLGKQIQRAEPNHQKKLN